MEGRKKCIAGFWLLTRKSNSGNGSAHREGLCLFSSSSLSVDFHKEKEKNSVKLK